MSNFPYLYKLSLAIGKSLDLKINCMNFLEELKTGKGLNFASVWINSKLIDPDNRTEQLSLVGAVSTEGIAQKADPVDHIHFENILDQPFLVLSINDVVFRGLFPRKGMDNCSSVILPLGETGFLQMLMREEKTNIFGKKTPFFKEDEFSDFLEILKRFTISLSHCIAFNASNRQSDDKGTKSANLFADKKTVATMSHEIRNPMNAIMGFSELLGETELSKKQTEYLEVVKTSSKHLFNVLNEVLDYSKILARQFALEEITFDINALLRVLINSNKPEAEKRAIELSYTVDKWITKSLVGDKHKLLHALQYLVDNAIKFTNSGFVRINCKLVDATEALYKLNFSVEDSGIGIEAKNLRKIFKSFTQEDDSITRKFGGLGLGLSISRYIIQALGGELDVQSKKGEGSIFSFTLSFKADNGSSSDQELHLLQFDKSKTGNIRVLLVDDDPHQRNLGGECLSDWDYKTANNGREAVEILSNDGSFDIVLMDIRMPVMDGIEATRIIRNTLKLKMPIIAVSGEVVEGTIRECTEAGMNSFVSKPYKREELISRMVMNLDRLDLYNPAEDNHELESLKGKKALVVEDNLINQMVTVRQLKNLLCEVDVIDDGKLVLDKIQENSYDFVLMDLYMTEMGGFEATKELRKNRIDIPVIAFSGDDSSETVDSCLEAGMNGLILKPCSSAEMASKINALIYNCQNPKADENKLYDLNFLQSIFVNNPDRMKDSIKKFIVETPSVLGQLNHFMAENNYDQLWRKAHFIKSSALSLGIKFLKDDLEAIVRFGKKIEKNEAVSETEKKELPILIGNVNRILNEALVQLAKEIG